MAARAFHSAKRPGISIMEACLKSPGPTGHNAVAHFVGFAHDFTIETLAS